MEKMKLYTHDEMLDKAIGEKGTVERAKYDARMDAFLMGEALKKARESKKMTQDELGRLMGVQKSQISKIESGKRDLSFSTIIRALRAMGIQAKFDMGAYGSYAF